MRFTPEKTKYQLLPENVDNISEDVHRFLTALKAQKKNILETRLTVEEILLELTEKFGDTYEITYIKNNFFGKPYITIAYEGEPFNPLEKEADDEFGNWSSVFIQNAEYTPSYSYEHGMNSITMRFSKEGMNPVLKLMIAIAVAVLISLLRFVAPAETVTFIKENVLDSFYSAFLGLMATVEIPLVFLSITCGILGIGDSAVFGRIGRKMVLRFLTVILFFTAIAGIIFSMLFTGILGNKSAAFSVKVGVDLLLDLIPSNLIEPITSGNTMQIVIMAVVIGVTLVILGSKAKTVSKIINEGNRMIIYITGIVSRLLPLFIIVVIVDMVWNGNLRLLLDMWKPIAAFIAVLLLLFSIMLITVSSREGVSARLLLKKMLPTFLIGLGTASSIAANGECSEALYGKMGVNKRFVEFGQPTGGVIFMPATAICFMVCAAYMASYYQVKVSMLWFIIAILLCSFVAVATPPVPGGAVAAYTVIFLQLGIPSEAVATVVALDIIFDFIATAFDGAFLQLELIRQADENKMINLEILRK